MCDSVVAVFEQTAVISFRFEDQGLVIGGVGQPGEGGEVLAAAVFQVEVFLVKVDFLKERRTTLFHD